jgi:hypothetical protein
MWFPGASPIFVAENSWKSGETPFLLTEFQVSKHENPFLPQFVILGPTTDL